VTLLRLLLAWLPVAAVFAVVGGLGTRFYSANATDREDEWTKPEKVWVFATWDLLWRSLEAAAVTLVASLWFSSLGHGEWWLLFSLLGLTVSLAQLQGSATSIPGTPPGTWRRREALVRAIRDVARYVVAGAILAWILR
jgi:hypothetical protein